MSSAALVSRVSHGVPSGGQFAPTEFPEPEKLSLPGDVTGARGEELTDELLRLPKVDAFARVLAGRSADVLRESHEDYWPAGTSPTSTPEEARAEFRNSLSHLDDERTAHHFELVSFAIAIEVKAIADREHILHPDHEWEVLIDTSNFRTDDDLVDNGNQANQEAWEDLANTAMVAALDENTAASLRLTA